MADIEKEQTMEAPDHLKDAHYPAAKKLGHGKGYKYPHDYGGYVEQEYLPKRKSIISPLLDSCAFYFFLPHTPLFYYNKT